MIYFSSSIGSSRESLEYLCCSSATSRKNEGPSGSPLDNKGLDLISILTLYLRNIKVVSQSQTNVKSHNKIMRVLLELGLAQPLSVR